MKNTLHVVNPLRGNLYVPLAKEPWLSSIILAKKPQDHHIPDGYNLDLEDGVLYTSKEKARQNLVVFLDGHKEQKLNKDQYKTQIALRINGIDSKEHKKDTKLLEKVNFSPLDIIILPKVESKEHIQEILPLAKKFSIKISPIIETIKGLHNIDEILDACKKSKEVTYIRSAATGDYAYERLFYSSKLPVHHYDNTIESQMLIQYTNTLNEYAIKHNFAVIGSIFFNIQELKSNVTKLKKECAIEKALGCVGKDFIHPNHTSTINVAFSSNPDQIKNAREIVVSYEQALANGRPNPKVDFNSRKLVYLPSYMAAKTFLKRHGE